MEIATCGRAGSNGKAGWNSSVCLFFWEFRVGIACCSHGQLALYFSSGTRLVLTTRVDYIGELLIFK